MNDIMDEPDGIQEELKAEGYMDDIMPHGETREECRRNTIRVLKKLSKHGLGLNPEKCEFEQEEVDFLGFVVGHGKISMDPVKVEGLSKWPTPKTLKELRSFLGFGNFYRRFIKGYSGIASPLHALQGKDVPFVWTKECDDAFETLKTRFTSYPVLLMPDPTRPFQIEADASKYASGAVLTQLDETGARHPISFYSKTFSDAERNYQIYDRELLAILRALQEWRHFIQGSPFTTVVLSDHQNLTYWKNPQKLSPRQARAFLTLSEYNFLLKHQPGASMIQSDALSRRADFAQGEEEPKEVTMLPESVFVNLIDLALQEQILNSNKLDAEANDALKLLLEEGPTDLRNDLSDWTLETKDGKQMLFRKGKAYIPDDLNLRREIVKKHHDSPTVGHPGELGTFNAVKENYWWPAMRRFVKAYVEGCPDCQQFKINRHPTKPTLLPIPSPKSNRPFTQLSMDFITDLPPSNGFDSLLVVVDHGLTKGVILEPCNKTITAEQTATILVRRVFSRFGVPDKIISDRGPQFAAKTF